MWRGVSRTQALAPGRVTRLSRLHADLGRQAEDGGGGRPSSRDAPPVKTALVDVQGADEGRGPATRQITMARRAHPLHGNVCQRLRGLRVRAACAAQCRPHVLGNHGGRPRPGGALLAALPLAATRSAHRAGHADPDPRERAEITNAGRELGAVLPTRGRRARALA